MTLVLDDLPRDPDRLLQHLRRMTEVITQQNASLVSLQAKHDTVLAERDAARTEGQVVGTERDLLREEHEAAQEAAIRSSDTPRPPRSRRRNLGALPTHLPRLEVLVDVEDKSCPCCGRALHAIGEDTSEMLDLVPAQLRVKVIRR